MLYKFKINRLDDLLDGRSVVWIANKIGYSRTSVSRILNGRILCRKVVAQAIVKTIDEKYEIDDFFDLIEGE